MTGEKTIERAIEKARLEIESKTVDIPIAIASGEEVDFEDIVINSYIYNAGVLRVHGNLLLKANGRIKLVGGSILRFVR